MAMKSLPEKGAGRARLERAVIAVLLVFAVAGAVLYYLKQTHWWLPETEIDRTGRFHARIDINSATHWQLDYLPLIGEVKAQRIIEYREKHGPFKSLDELKNVPGIGDGIVERMRPYVCVGKGEGTRGVPHESEATTNAGPSQ